MICPNCKNQYLTRVDYKSSSARKGIQLDYCPTCYGIWFDRDELRRVKDKEDEFLRWIDIDIWKDGAKFQVSKSGRICPVCEVPFYTIKYGGSSIEIDLCSVCQGIWLDKGELDEIIKYLEEKVDKESLLGYLKDIGEEFLEIFVHPKKLSSEVGDLLIVMKLFEYRLLSQVPVISKIIARLPE